MPGNDLMENCRPVHNKVDHLIKSCLGAELVKLRLWFAERYVDAPRAVLNGKNPVPSPNEGKKKTGARERRKLFDQ